MKRLILILSLLAVVLLMTFTCGCSNMTPAQVYRADAALYVIADVGATAGVAANKIPASDVPAVKVGLGVAKRNLDALRAWIAANPNLANTIGVTPAELTATEAAIEILSGYIAKYSLLAPLPQP